MSNVTRVTKKSRMVSDLSDIVVELVCDSIFDPSKQQIVERAVKSSLNEGASSIMVELLSAEMSNMLDNYFADVCKCASEELDLAYHMTSKKWYQRGRKFPESEAEAKQYVVVFGNGRTGKSAGVRYVTVEDKPDAMLLVALSKRVDVVNEAFRTRNARLRNDLKDAAIDWDDQQSLTLKLPREVITM